MYSLKYQCAQRVSYLTLRVRKKEIKISRLIHTITHNFIVTKLQNF